jgi:hypothetical protein
VAWFGVWFGVKFNKQGLVLGAVFGAVRVLGGAKQTSKGLAWCRVLSKDKVRVLCGAK